MSVTTAEPDGPERCVELAREAFAAALTPEQLKVARLEHESACSPLALIRRGIGELPPEQRTPVAVRVGRARAEITKAWLSRQRQLKDAR